MIVGDVLETPTATVVIGTATYLAGVRRDRSEVAYMGPPPRTFPASLTIDGQPYVATHALKDAAKGFAVLACQPAPAAPPAKDD